VLRNARDVRDVRYGHRPGYRPEELTAIIEQVSVELP
jgi:hypothetical protein